MNEAQIVLDLLQSGNQPDEGLVQRGLRSPSTLPEFFVLLSECHWAIRDHRLVSLAAAHPNCPRHLALQLLHHLGWHDLLQVARWPRAPVPVRRQAERRLLERLPTLTLGERINLARLAPRTVILGMLADPNVKVIQALLNSPQCTEIVPVRMLTCHPSAEVVSSVLRHPKWGLLPTVRLAAVRSSNTPEAVALGLMATLTDSTLQSLAESWDLAEALRSAAYSLRERRARKRGSRVDKAQPEAAPLASAGSPPKLGGQ